jgi:hypothetical protein
MERNRKRWRTRQEQEWLWSQEDQRRSSLPELGMLTLGTQAVTLDRGRVAWLNISLSGTKNLQGDER